MRAVTFSHNMNLHGHWGDKGDPVKSDTPRGTEDIEVTSIDSGVGLNLALSTSRIKTRSGSSVSETPPSSQLVTSALPDIEASQTAKKESIESDGAPSHDHVVYKQEVEALSLIDCIEGIRATRDRYKHIASLFYVGVLPCL